MRCCVTDVVDEMKSEVAVCRHCRNICSQSDDDDDDDDDNDDDDDDVYSWIYSHSRLTTSSVAPVTGCGLCVGAVVNDSQLAAMVTDRCQARGAGARLCPRDAASDRAVAERFVDAVDSLDAAAGQLRAGVDRAESALVEIVGDMQRRVAFHVRVGLAGVQTSFMDGFAAAFETVRERSLLPLVADGGYDTVANLERTVKQLTFTSLSETVARKVQLSIIYENINIVIVVVVVAVVVVVVVVVLYSSSLSPRRKAKPRGGGGCRFIVAVGLKVGST